VRPVVPDPQDPSPAEDLHERVHDLEQVVEEYRLQMNKVLTSASWRLTSPLRLAAGKVRWYRGRLRHRLTRLVRRRTAPREPVAGGQMPDLDRLPETSPLRRLTERPGPSRGVPRVVPPAGRPAVLVVAHVHYPELWDDIGERLTRIPAPFDLIVTLTRRHGERAADRIAAAYPRAHVEVVPNQGRDWAPLISLANRGLLGGYQAVAKVHTKRSEHRLKGHRWRLDLLDGVLPGPVAISRAIELLTEDDRIGMIVPTGHISGPGHWGSDRAVVEALASRLPLPFHPDRLAFPAGSMFWCRSTLLDRLGELALSVHHFELEVGQYDGTTAHGLERLVGVMCTAEGLDLVEQAGVARRLRDVRRRALRSG